MKRLVRKSIDDTAEISLNELISDCSDFSNWVFPDASALQLEYQVEYQNHLKYEFGDIWPTEESFLEVANNGSVIDLSKGEDEKIGNRSYTVNMDELLDLLKSYKSWPEFRNTGTVQEIVEGFKEDQPMIMPIVVEEDGYSHIMSGNTRLDIAFMMNVTPKVLWIKI